MLHHTAFGLGLCKDGEVLNSIIKCQEKPFANWILKDQYALQKVAPDLGYQHESPRDTIMLVTCENNVLSCCEIKGP